MVPGVMKKEAPLPSVVINGAVSLDGKLALENRSLIQFSSARDRRSVFALRARMDAVLCGAETVQDFSIDLAAGPERYRRERKRLGLAPEPLRILVASTGDVDTSARIFHKPVSPVIVFTTRKSQKRCRAKVAHVAVVQAFGRDAFDFPAAFRWLRTAHGVRSVVCEGGGETNAELLRAGVVDHIHVTMCPLILRGRHAPTLCDGAGVSSLAGARRLKLKSARAINGELFLVYDVVE